MEQIVDYAPLSPLSIGIGIGVAIILFLKCVLFHGDPVSCLKCLVYNLIFGFLFVAKAKTSSSSASSSSSSSSSSSGCNCERSEIPEPLLVEPPGSRLDHEDRETISWQEVKMVMQRLGIFSISPDSEETVGPQEIEQVFVEQEPSLGEVKDAFDVFDKDRDGFIDAVELRDVLWALGLREVSEVDCKRLIRAYDENKDGLIDFGEFTKLVEKSFCVS